MKSQSSNRIIRLATRARESRMVFSLKEFHSTDWQPAAGKHAIGQGVLHCDVWHHIFEINGNVCSNEFHFIGLLMVSNDFIGFQMASNDFIGLQMTS